MSSLSFARVRARTPYTHLLSMGAALLSLAAISQGAIAAPPLLTLGEAQQQAVARSYQLTAQDQASTAAREMAVAAGQLPDPVLKAGIDNLPVSGRDRFSLGNDFMTMRRVGVSQELTRADKRRWRSARLEREADKAQAQKDVVVAAIQRDTAVAWLDLYYTQQVAGVIAEQANVARQEIAAAEAAYRGGRGSQADILAARSAWLALNDRDSEIDGRLRVARTKLGRWTGVAGEVAPNGAPDIDKIRLDPATLDTDLAHHPQIAVMEKQEDIAQAEANLARANRQADWSVDVAFQQRGSAYSNMVSAGISIPLQWDRKNRQDRELAAKLAAVEQTKAERQELLRDHVAEARAMMVEWQSGRERMARYAGQLVPLAGDRSQAVLAAYRGGKATLAEVLAARRSETELRLQSLAIQMATARLWAQLNFLFPVDGTASHPMASRNQDSQ